MHKLSVATSSSDSDGMLTIDRPSSLKEWAQVRSASSAISLVLPDGLEIGQRYQVVKLLGMGGMGAVYRVLDRELDRDVALKLIRSEIGEDPDVLERFKREIQLSSRVTHRNVLRVFDLGESDGIRFLTMQYVDGTDLSSILKHEGALPVPRVVEIFRQICEGLNAAHELGVVHRDLKPQNVMVDGSGRVFLMDFGLAKSREQSAMTQTGAVLGTPLYMSPEQVKGEPTDARSDIYALGIILYQMLTGALPFTGTSPYEVMSQRLHRPPRPISELNPSVPAYLRKIVDRCLALDPRLRYASAGEVLSDLDSEAFRPTLRYQVRRRRWLLPAAGIVAAAAALAIGVTVWLSTRAPAHEPAEPRSVLISDFVNRTGDPVFEGTLEPAFALALEGASFITSYDRRQARKIASQLQPGTAGMTEPLARLVAVREGVNVITAGSVSRKGDSYRVSVRAVDPSTGKALVEEEVKVTGKGDVLAAIAKLATRVRTALGDTTPKSRQLAAAETFTAGSLDAAHEYGLAQDLQWAGKWDDAIAHYLRALQFDPNLGRAYAGLAAVENNRGRRDDAERNYRLALARMERMSEREKYRTRGGYYLLTRKPDNAIEEFSALVKAYPADTAGIANLAFAYFVKRDMANALEWGRRAIEIYPKNVPQRNNYGLIAMYAGDFGTGIREQTTVLQMNPRFVLGYVGLSLSQLGAGQTEAARETWERLSTLGPEGHSAAAAGLADLALYEGRLTDARRILEKSIADDVASKNSNEAARKLATLAEAHLAAGDSAAAVETAERALSTGGDDATLISASRVLVEAEQEKTALAIASRLEQRLEPDPQMYALLLRGEIELKRRNFREAIRLFGQARKQSDAWLVRYDLGRAYLGAEAYAEADAELNACEKRRGEALAVYLDEVPTSRLLPMVSYYLGRAREGLKSPGAVEAYQSFLAVKKGEEELLVADARRRAGSR